MTGETDTSGLVAVNFPISFNVVFSIAAIDGGDIGVMWGIIRSSISGADVTFIAKKYDGTVKDLAEGYYIAIGQS